jgi:fructokinase
MSGALVLVAGEALYDLWVDAAGDAHGRPGGGPFNTARTLARLERPVAYLGRLSNDAPGRVLRARLADDGVGLGAVIATDDPTMLALAEIGDDGGARYAFYTEGTAARGLTPGAALAALPAGVAVLHVGTLGLVLEPMASALEAVVQALAPSALVVVDPNCRPWAIADPAGYRARLTRVLARTHLLKVSEEDLAWLHPDLEPAAAARALLALGPTVALLTRGGKGATVVTADTEVAIPAPAVEVVDTIGAGDAFAGGFLAWWGAQGLGRRELADVARVGEGARFAARVAGRTCERAGADPPRLAELEEG